MEEFKHLNPKKLEWCYKGHKLKKEEEDRNTWQRWGDYGISALIFAIDHCLNGKKARTTYVEKPISEKIAHDNDPKYKESNEQVAVYEMKQRINELRKMGLPESPD